MASTAMGTEELHSREEQGRRCESYIFVSKSPVHLINGIGCAHFTPDIIPYITYPRNKLQVCSFAWLQFVVVVYREAAVRIELGPARHGLRLRTVHLHGSTGRLTTTGLG